MNQYQPYSMNNYLPYQQMYPQQMPQQSMQNIYMDRLAQIQAMQSQNVPPAQMQTINYGLNGKVVEQIENITANDVPMDGNVAIFPRRDMTEIYVKNWTPNGTIQTVVFKPVEVVAGNVSPTEKNLKIGLSDEVSEAIFKKFDEMSDRFDKLEKSISKQSKSVIKKESDE